MMEIDRVLSRIDDEFDRHVDRVRAFVRQPSISGEGVGMQEMAEMMRDTITRLGGNAEIVPTPGWPVVYGALAAGRAKTLLLCGMYDVQPVEGEEWMVPPFAGQAVTLPEFGPSIVARGVYNTKGPLAGMFNVIEAIRQADGRLPVNVKFVIEGEEELGSRNLPGFINAYRDKLKADATYFAFYCQERHGKPVLWLGVKGIQYFEVTCRGGAWGGPRTRGVHGSNAVWIGNPAWRLVRALATMMTDDEQIQVAGFRDDVVPPTAADEAGGDVRSGDAAVELGRRALQVPRGPRRAPTPLSVRSHAQHRRRVGWIHGARDEDAVAARGQGEDGRADGAEHGAGTRA